MKNKLTLVLALMAIAIPLVTLFDQLQSTESDLWIFVAVNAVAILLGATCFVFAYLKRNKNKDGVDK